MTWSRFRKASDAVRYPARASVLALAVFIAMLAGGPSPAHATLKNGENAVDVLGQFTSPSTDTTDDWVKGCPNNGASSLGFGQPIASALDATNHWLYVVDNNNNRVLVFPLTSGNVLSSKTPSYVLGQPDFVTCVATINPATASGMDNPSGVAVDPVNQRLFVADTYLNRVTVFNTSSMSNGMNASYALGQTSLTAYGANTSQSGFTHPYAVAYDSTNTRLFVADYGNARVLVFNVATGTIATGENASYELGQPGTGGGFFANANCGLSQSGMCDPEGLAYDSTNTRLFVSDYAYNRVTVYNVATGTIANDENASYVLGQSSYTASGSAATQSGLNEPQNLDYDSANTRLFVADQNNNRVMVFNVATGTIANGENASFELGETSFTSVPGGVTQAIMNNPQGVTYDSTNNYLYVDDSTNNRVTIFNVNSATSTLSPPTQGGSDACVIADGQLYCWGGNTYGELGLGNTTQFETPQQVGAAINWTAIRQGDSDYDDSACGIAGGALYCWGRNTNGELGLGNTTQYTTPQQVGAATNWTVISQSGSDACGIAGGALYCWGINTYGELGLGNTTQYTTSQQVGSATNWTAISQGGSDTCGIAGGALYCWGWNGDGEDGLGNTTQHSTPQQVGSATNWTATSIQYDENGGDADACGIAGGALYCWGINTYGELGLGNTTQFKTPQQVGTLTTWSAISFGRRDTCGVAGSQLYCWGQNSLGEDGIGNATEQKSPQAVTVDILANDEDAYDELGEYNSPSSTSTVVYTQNGPNNGPTALGFNGASAVAIDPVNHYLYAADYTNNRVLVYTLNTDNSIPTASGGHTATYVLGQASLDGPNGNGHSASTMHGPRGLAVDSANQRLFVADEQSSRVLVFNTSSISNGMNASYALGQTSLTVTGAAQAQNRMDYPRGLAYDAANNRLFVAESLNNRVTVWPVATGTIATGENASYELGQPSANAFTTNTAATSQSGLSGPSGVAYDATDSLLYVADTTNNRVMVFNVATGTIANGENASYLLGQTAWNGLSSGSTASTMNGPYGVAYDPNSSRLFVGESGNDRVTVFNVSPTLIANGMNASFVIGQPNLSGSGKNTAQNGLGTVWGIAYDPATTHLFVGDDSNDRIMIFDGTVLPYWPPGYE